VAALPPDLLELELAVEQAVASRTLRVPPYPPVALRVQEALGRKEVGLAEVARLVGADAVLAAAILRCANSAMFRRGAPVTDLPQALTRIGAAEVMRLLLASALSSGAQAVGPLVAARRLIWVEGLTAAAVTQELARLRGLRAEEAFVVGLLHDFGKVVAATAFEAILEDRRAETGHPLETWLALLARQHVSVGVTIAERWGLPPLVGEVIAAHHGGTVRCRDPKLLAAVQTADAIVGLILTRRGLGEGDLKDVPGLARGERAEVARVIGDVPEFVAAFETPAAGSWVGSPNVAPAEAPAGAARKVKFGLSVAVARRPRLFTATGLLADGLVATGEEALPENRLLEAKIYARAPFTMWVLTRSCVKTPEGFRVELQPFALTGVAREGWDALEDEQAGGPQG
jgi:putative nucleotidyltransferase with HDIG domain